MKVLAYVIVILGMTITSQAMSERSKVILKNFIIKYQQHQNIPCTLHFLNTFIDFVGISENEKFQFKHGLSLGKLTSTCNIFICTSEFVGLSESKKIDQFMKNHIWVIDGQYSKKHFSWPVIEVRPQVVKLYCSKYSKPMLILHQRVMLCPEYPISDGREIKVAIMSFPPFTFAQPDGSLKGFDYDSHELLSEYLHYSPKYQFTNSWDEAFLMVQNGSVDSAAKASLNPKRYSMVDITTYINYVEACYAVRVPQPVDVLYQFLQPFEIMVWIGWLSLLTIFAILIYLATNLAIWKIRHLQILNEIKYIDFLLYAFGMSLQPVLDHHWLDTVRSKTLSGALITIWLAITGFLIMNLYKTDLLSSLAAISFENPIDKVEDLLETNLVKYQFDDASVHQLKDHPRREFREIYKQAYDNGWIVGASHISIALKQLYSGGNFITYGA